MSLKSIVLAAASAALMSTAVFADGIMVNDPYALTARPNAPVGAAFMGLMNHSASDDRLIAARSDIAERVELHTHIEDSNGVMRMVEVEDGIALPAGGMALLARGGDHVMFMGLKAPLEQGDEIAVTLVFETAGEIEVTIPVDLTRMSKHGGQSHDHGHNHGHGTDG